MIYSYIYTYTYTYLPEISPDIFQELVALTLEAKAAAPCKALKRPWDGCWEKPWDRYGTYFFGGWKISIRFLGEISKT